MRCSAGIDLIRNEFGSGSATAATKTTARAETPTIPNLRTHRVLLSRIMVLNRPAGEGYPGDRPGPVPIRILNEDWVRIQGNRPVGSEIQTSRPPDIRPCVRSSKDRGPDAPKDRAKSTECPHSPIPNSRPPA